ncbi:SDR family oxidoreductase, partial [bacterium]|nr:SDR family oxidoreductase [bacterium]
RDILTYEQMVRNLADLLRVRRSFIRSPLSALRLHSYFLSLITPVPGPIVFCLMDGLKSDTVCENDHIRQHLEFCPLGYREALLLAFSREEQDNVATRWSDAYPPAHELALKLYEVTPRPRYRAVYSLPTQQSPADLFQSFCQVGGQEGWFHNNWMWRLRGMIDRVFFGVGTARGRRARRSLQINDVIDFWRVEDLRPGRRLLLRSEMKLPGRAWLEFLVRRVGKERRVVIVAYFDTRSLFGRLYWLVLLPFHGVIFENLLRQIENRCGPLPRKASSAT